MTQEGTCSETEALLGLAGEGGSRDIPVTGQKRMGRRCRYLSFCNRGGFHGPAGVGIRVVCPEVHKGDGMSECHGCNASAQGYVCIRLGGRPNFSLLFGNGRRPRRYGWVIRARKRCYYCVGCTSPPPPPATSTKRSSVNRRNEKG